MSNLQTCDECGRSMEKAHRLHAGNRYCSTCYPRIFKRRMCPTCGNFARLPTTDPKAVCRRCELAKPCARCEKTEYEVAKITAYGPVCNVCAPYFKPLEPCESCGTPSRWLTRVSRFGHDARLCAKCARADHANCSACRRHRLLQSAPDGRMLCKVCLEKGEITCSQCSKPMPAGHGKVCYECGRAASLRKRVHIDQAAFLSGTMSSVFGEFGEWLLRTVGPHKAALTIHRYLPFFLEIERKWGAPPSYLELLGFFGAEGLRRVRLPMRWLCEAKGLVIDVQARSLEAERRQIEAIVASIPADTKAASALNEYRTKLVARVETGATTVRSARLALRPAASLLKAADATGTRLPDQSAVDRYLTAAPGQRAAITGFLNFLNESRRLQLIAKVDKIRVKAARKKQLEKQLLSIKASNKTNGARATKQWLSIALEYFHGLPAAVGHRITDKHFTMSADGGITVTWDGNDYWIPGLAALSAV